MRSVKKQSGGLFLASKSEIGYRMRSIGSMRMQHLRSKGVSRHSHQTRPKGLFFDLFGHGPQMFEGQRTGPPPADEGSAPETQLIRISTSRLPHQKFKSNDLDFFIISVRHNFYFQLKL